FSFRDSSRRFLQNQETIDARGESAYGRRSRNASVRQAVALDFRVRQSRGLGVVGGGAVKPHGLRGCLCRLCLFCFHFSQWINWKVHSPESTAHRARRPASPTRDSGLGTVDQNPAPVPPPAAVLLRRAGASD